MGSYQKLIFNSMFRKNIKVGLYLTSKGLLRENKVLLTMSVGILILVFINLMLVPNLIQGLVNTIYTKLQDTQISQIQIQPSQQGQLIQNSNQLVEEIQKITGVDGTVSTFNIQSELNFEGNKTTFGTLVVEDKQSFEQTFNIEKYLTDGELFNGSESNQIILGAEVAGQGQFDELRGSLEGVEVGDKITLNFLNKESEFEVVGIYDAEFAQADTNSYIRLADFEKLYPEFDTSPQIINVAVNELEEVDRIIDEINQLENFEIEANSWEKVTGVIDDTIQSFVIMGNIVQVVSLIIGAITVFIITYVDLTNKQKQIGIERAIGITPQAIFLNFIFKGVATSLLAIILGTLIYVYVVVPLEHTYPLQFPFCEALIAVNYTTIVQMTVLLVVVVIFSSAIPTMQLLKKPILKTIWG